MAHNSLLQRGNWVSLSAFFTEFVRGFDVRTPCNNHIALLSLTTITNESINGGDYKRKTTAKLDVELGSDEGMRAYILGYGHTSLDPPGSDNMEEEV